MLFLGLLCCCMLSSIHPVLMEVVWDQRCVDNCSCCTDKDCGEIRFPNSCLKGCIDGHRGERCYELCKYENCKSCGGNTNSNECTECYDGYYLGEKKDCTSPCPSNCKSCTSSTMCSKCKEGFYDENGSTTCPFAYCPINCECTIGQMDCVSCKTGFYDTSRSCSQTCSNYCEGNVCESTSGFCINGCKSKNITGNTCNECKIGMYGELCNIMCSKNCRNKWCGRYNGSCSEGCIGNFDWIMCDLCINGKYGETCELDCPVNCAGKVCEKTSGTCSGCIGYFKGEKCDQCMSGYYGPNCDKLCSQQCANDNCHRNTGDCIYGCRNGYSGDRCCVKGERCLECTNNTLCRKCAQGFFKNACYERCPEDCLGSCDISTGECSDCQYNRFGQFCEFNCSPRCMFEEGIHERVCSRSNGTCINKCNDGYFGRTCNKTCSKFCIDGTCIQDDGVCIKGCEGHQDEPECFLSEAQKDNKDNAGKTSAILGTLFAMSAIINIVQGVYMLVKKRREALQRETSRQQPDVAHENPMMSSVPPFSLINGCLAVRYLYAGYETNGGNKWYPIAAYLYRALKRHRIHSNAPAAVLWKKTSVASADNTTVYEGINKVNEKDEEYQAISNIKPAPED